jgi:hypothetical protein
MRMWMGAVEGGLKDGEALRVYLDRSRIVMGA